jgi:hypothetical protein
MQQQLAAGSAVKKTGYTDLGKDFRFMLWEMLALQHPKLLPSKWWWDLGRRRRRPKVMMKAL